MITAIKEHVEKHHSTYKAVETGTVKVADAKKVVADADFARCYGTVRAGSWLKDSAYNGSMAYAKFFVAAEAAKFDPRKATVSQTATLAKKAKLQRSEEHHYALGTDGKVSVGGTDYEAMPKAIAALVLFCISNGMPVSAKYVVPIGRAYKPSLKWKGKVLVARE